MRPPIGGESSDLQVGLRNELRVDITRGLGSIQVFADQPRQRAVVLVTTSGAWSLIQPLLGYIDQLPDGWSDLRGDVLVAGAAGTVTNLSIGPDDIASTAVRNGTNWQTWLAIGAGCVALAVLGLAAALWWRRLKGQRRSDCRHRRAQRSALRRDAGVDAVEQLTEAGAEFGQWIVGCAVEHTGVQRGLQRWEARRVDQSVEQAGVVVVVDRADLDGQRCRATDEVKHRHDRGQLLALGEGVRANAASPASSQAN